MVAATKGMVQPAELILEAGLLQELKIGPLVNWFIDQFGIGVQDGIVVSVHYGSVVDCWPIALYGFNQCIEVAVLGKIFSDGAAYRFRVVGIDFRACQVRDCVVGQECYLRGQVVGSVASIKNLLMQDL